MPRERLVCNFKEVVMTRHTAHSIGMEISRYHKVSSTNRVAGSYKFFTQHLFRTMDHIDTNRNREYHRNLNSTSGVKGAGCKLFVSSILANSHLANEN
jgi:hypothetical protein